MEIQVKYLVDDIDKVGQAHPGEWVDLRCAEDTRMWKGDFRKIPLGVVITVPSGYECILAPRSSTFEKYAIIQTNGIGVIDHSYCGPEDEWKMPAIAACNTYIPKNARIAQFKIVPSQGDIVIREVKEVNRPSRGGFGSTGEQ